MSSSSIRNSSNRALDRGASGWDSARESHPFSQRREPRAGTWDWTKPSIAEVLDQGGGAAVERERAYPVPSPRGTLPTWILSGDDLNLVHNRRSSLVQARISGFFLELSLWSFRPAFTSFAFSFLPSPTEAWVVLVPHPICHKSQEYIRRGRSLVPRQGPTQGYPVADCALPDHAIAIPPPTPGRSRRARFEALGLRRTELVDDRTGKTAGLTFLFFYFNFFDRALTPWTGSGTHHSLVSRHPNSDLSADSAWHIFLPPPPPSAAHRHRHRHRPPELSG